MFQKLKHDNFIFHEKYGNSVKLWVVGTFFCWQLCSMLVSFHFELVRITFFMHYPFHSNTILFRKTAPHCVFWNLKQTLMLSKYWLKVKWKIHWMRLFFSQNTYPMINLMPIAIKRRRAVRSHKQPTVGNIRHISKCLRVMCSCGVFARCQH